MIKRPAMAVAASLVGVAAMTLNGIPAMSAANNAAPVVPAIALGTATARVTGTTLYIDGGSADNYLSHNLGSAYLKDTSGLTADVGCAQVDLTTVDCGGYGTYSDLVIDLGDGNDTATLGAFIYTYRIRLQAGSGDDTVYSGDGEDELSGGPGNDFLAGGVGRDKVDGQEGDDTLRGGSGDDTITGGPGMDSVDGDGGSALDDGNDRIYLADGQKDVAQCGFGADMVEADGIDVVEDLSCESVSRAPVPPATPQPTTSPVTPPPTVAPTTPLAGVTGLKVVIRRGRASVTWKTRAGATSYKVRYSKPGAKKYRAWRTINEPRILFKVRSGTKYAVQVVPVGVAVVGPRKTLRFRTP